MRKRTLLWALVPLLAYPALAGGLLALDAVRGERLLGHYLRYDRRLLLDTLLSDYASATPALVAGFAVLALVYHGVRRLRPGASPLGLRHVVVALLAATVLSVFVARARPQPLALAPDVRPTAERIYVVGGGPSPHDSQAQIEFNVSWVLSTLEELVPDGIVRVFYANGDGPEPGTVEHLPEPEGEARRYEPLARVFGFEEENRLRYRPHAITQAEGSTAAETLIPALEDDFRSLVPGEQAFFVYNGHGSWESDRAENALRLWGESRLTARDFERLLSQVDTGVPARFFFTQCYSGAFERVVHPGARDVMELAAGNRCGFMAESEDRESEGCSASIAVGDYRDYTTYFFAALSGTTRLGEAVGERRDWDGDGTVTPFDAHVFTLVNGRNGDLPRSTSEVYLERWMPWGLRWAGTADLPDNLYGEAARQMARDHDLPEDNPRLGRAVRDRYDQLVGELGAAYAEVAGAQNREAAIQDLLAAEVILRWPVLDQPFTAGFQGVVDADLDAVTRFIVAHPDYPELVAAQSARAELELRLVELDRNLSQLEKLQRTRMLARALQHLERFGGPEHREAYASLRRCEALPLDLD